MKLPTSANAVSAADVAEVKRSLMGKINARPSSGTRPVSDADVAEVRRSLMGKTNVKPSANAVSNADVAEVRRSLMGKTNVRPSTSANAVSNADRNTMKRVMGYKNGGCVMAGRGNKYKGQM